MVDTNNTQRTMDDGQWTTDDGQLQGYGIKTTTRNNEAWEWARPVCGCMETTVVLSIMIVTSGPSSTVVQ